MGHITDLERLGLAMVGFALAVVGAGTPVSHAQQGVGAKYDTRDPHTCASTKDPREGAISAEQAKQYFLCEAEGESPSGASTVPYLVEDVKVEVGKGTTSGELFDERPVR